MELYTQRNNMRMPVEKTEVISADKYSMLLDCCKKYYDNIAWKYPELCSDNGLCCGLNIQQFTRNIKYIAPNLFCDKYGNIVPPADKIENLAKWAFNDVLDKEEQYDQYALLDFIEFTACNIKDIVSKNWHSYMQHYHLEFTSSTDFTNSFNDFRTEINEIFEMTGLLFTLTEKKEVERIIDNSVISQSIVSLTNQVSEHVTKKLLQEALELFRKPHPTNRQTALEKIWDALERLKTYYLSSTIDKKASVTQIVTDMCDNKQEFRELFNAEFKALTDIGNNFRIRHHEKNAIEITDPRHYDYFFNRCLSLIALAIQYLK